MTRTLDPELDLNISRIIRAPRATIWKAFTDPDRFSQWWVPAPSKCRVVEMDFSPGGAFVTEISEDGAPFAPHMNACFLAVDESKRLVFTNSLVAGWRPAEHPFMTAIITLEEHPEGTHYNALVMHRNSADRNMHEELGFHDGWGSVIEQLAALVERV
jgi:uncharacterized protein YndB with AHSA1/START domain